VNKIRFVILVLALVLLSACTPTLQDEPRPLSLRFRGVDLTVGAKADGIIARLGDDYTVTEAESCAGVGVDRMYTYPSVRLYVFAPEGGEAVISSVSYTDDGVQTADVLHIGSASADVIATMGQPDDENDVRLIYRSEDAVLTFGLRDGVVVSVVLEKKG
jgi:hypothetical protein